MHYRTPQTGFTLVEAVISIAILAILLSIAIPGFQSLSESARITTAVNDFVASLHIARAEAVKSASWVALCPSSSGAECDGGHTDWAGGYLIYLDQDRDKSKDTDEAIVGTVSAAPETLKIQSSSSYRVNLFYRADGRSWESNTSVRFCSNDFPDLNRVVIVSATGRPRVSERMPDGSKISCS